MTGLAIYLACVALWLAVLVALVPWPILAAIPAGLLAYGFVSDTRRARAVR